jgi:hypothetical protein
MYDTRSSANLMKRGALCACHVIVEGEELRDGGSIPTSPKELARMRAREREYAKEVETLRLRERRKAERKRVAADKHSVFLTSLRLHTQVIVCWWMTYVDGDTDGRP